MFIDKLFSQGMITNRIFSFYMTDQSYQSSFQIGGFDKSYQKDPTLTLRYIPLSDTSMFWNVDVDAFSVGIDEVDAIDGKINSWYFDIPTEACFDTGTSLMYVPSRVFRQLMKRLTKDLTYAIKDTDGYYWGPCDLNQYQSLYLLMNNNWFEIPASVYVEAVPG